MDDSTAKDVFEVYLERYVGSFYQNLLDDLNLYIYTDAGLEPTWIEATRDAASVTYAYAATDFNWLPPEGAFGPIFNDVWRHFAVTFDAVSDGYLAYYLDGILLFNTTGVGLGFSWFSPAMKLRLDSAVSWLTNDRPQQLNADHGATIDELAFFSRALTPSEVARIYGRSVPTNHADLVGYWTFDDGSGSLAHDSSPNGRHLTLANPTSGRYPTLWRPSRAPVYGSGLQVAYAAPSVTTLVDLSYLAPSAADLPLTTFCLVTPPLAGQLNYTACSSNPIYTYRPDNTFTSSDTATFEVIIRDFEGILVRSYSATLALTDPASDPLEVVPHIKIHLDEDNPYGLGLPISGGDMSSRRVVVTSLPLGMLYRSVDLVQMNVLLTPADIENQTPVGLNLVYHPNLNDYGLPLTNFSYRAWDDYNEAIEGHVVIYVRPVLDMPTIHDGLYVTSEGTPSIIKLNVSSVETSLVFAMLQHAPQHGKLYQYNASAPDLLGPELFAYSTGSSGQLVQAWASGVVGFSTEYGTCDIGYGSCAALGKHDVAAYGDSPNGWEPHWDMSEPVDPNDYSEYLELSYNVSLHVSALEIWETFNPGSIVRVSLRDPTGEWQPIWEDDPLTCLKSEIRIFSPDMCTTSYRTDAVRIELNTAVIPGWKAIDAVMLIGSEDWGPGVVAVAHSDFKVVYVPNPYVNDDDASGEPLDSFSFKVVPCSYYHSYQEEPLATLTATVSVTPVNDAPASYDAVQAVSEGAISVIWLRSCDVDLHQNHTAMITALPLSGVMYEPLLSDAPFQSSSAIHTGSPILSVPWVLGCGPLPTASAAIAAVSLPALCPAPNLAAAVSDDPSCPRAGFTFAFPVLYEPPSGKSCVPGNYSLNFVVADGAADSPEATATLQVTCTPLTCSGGMFADSSTYRCLPCPLGTYESDGVCLPCPAGSLADSAGSVQCDKCSPGTFSALSGAFECEQCPVGYYSDLRGSIACTACPPGRFSNSPGSSSCSLCFKGFYQPNVAETSCLSCPKGYIAAEMESSECTACPPGSYNDDIARAQCTAAQEGFFVPNAAAAFPIPCPQFATTFEDQSVSDSECVCSPGYYSVAPLQLNETWSCIKCPSQGAACYGGTSLIPLTGWWLPWWDPLTPVMCETNACLQGGSCAEGYLNSTTNPICAECDAGFTRYNEYECKRCPPPAENKALMFIACAILCVVASYLMWSSIRSAHSRDLTVSVVLKILLSYVQINSMAPGLPLKWPEVIRLMFRYQGDLSSSIDSIMSIDCLLQDSVGPGTHIPRFYLKVLFYMMLPIASFVIPAIGWTIFFFLRRYFARPIKEAVVRRWSLASGRPLPDPVVVQKARTELGHIMDGFIATVAITLFMLHPDVSRTTLELFRCKHLGTHSFLVRDMSVECYTPEHTFYVMVLGLPSVFLYVLGIPAVTLAVLYFGRKRLNDPSFEIRFAFVYKGYKEEYYWWEMVVIFLKVVIIFITVYFTALFWLQALLALGVLVAAVLANSRAMPYQWKSVAFLDFTSVLVSMSTIYLGLYISAGVATDAAGSMAATVVLLVMNLLVCCVFLYVFGLILVQRLRRHPRLLSWLALCSKYRISAAPPHDCANANNTQYSSKISSVRKKPKFVPLMRSAGEACGDKSLKYVSSPLDHQTDARLDPDDLSDFQKPCKLNTAEFLHQRPCSLNGIDDLCFSSARTSMDQSVKAPPFLSLLSHSRSLTHALVQGLVRRQSSPPGAVPDDLGSVVVSSDNVRPVLPGRSLSMSERTHSSVW